MKPDGTYILEKAHIGFFIVQMNISDKYIVNPTFINTSIFCYPFTAHLFLDFRRIAFSCMSSTIHRILDFFFILFFYHLSF